MSYFILHFGIKNSSVCVSLCICLTQYLIYLFRRSESFLIVFFFVKNYRPVILFKIAILYFFLIGLCEFYS